MERSKREDPQANKRRFLQIAGVALVGGAVVQRQAEGGINRFGADFTSYGVGLVNNPDLPGLAGELMMTLYIAVSADGTGAGTLSDVIHPAINSHLAILQTTRRGNQWHYEGQIVRSNTPGQVGLTFVADATVVNEFTGLELTLGGQTFTGEGMLIRTSSFMDPHIR